MWFAFILRVVRENLTSTTPVEFAYYSCEKFPAVCAHCGNKDCSVVVELKRSFRTVLPICKDCANSKESVTRGKFKHPSTADVSNKSQKKRKN